MAKKSVFIVKSNDLVEASYKITLDEMRVLLLAIGEINPKIKNHHRDFEFTVSDFAKRFGVSEKVAYKQVKDAIDKLGGRWALIESTDKVERKVTFLTEQVYFKGEGRFQIVLHEKLMPFVSEIQGKFTKYDLEYVTKFNGFHAIRLYEILAQFKNKGERIVSVDDLKEWLQVADKYTRWDNFKNRVLIPSITEINNKSDLFIDYRTYKIGRSIDKISFLISSKSKLQLENKRPPFPHKNKYGKFVKLDRINPKMSSNEYGLWARDCLKILNEFYAGKPLDIIPIEDIFYFWLFLYMNLSHTSKLGSYTDFYQELRKRGYKVVDCELVKIEPKGVQ